MQVDGCPSRAVTPSITLNFMPMSHVGGRQVPLTDVNGGTVTSVAKSDLSTLFE